MKICYWVLIISLLDSVVINSDAALRRECYKYQLQHRMFQGDLSLSGVARIGGKAALSLDLTCLTDEPSNTIIVFRLPKGIASLSQTVFENQYLQQDVPRRYSALIKIEEIGAYTLQASVYYTTQAGKNASQHFYTFLSVTESQSQLGDIPFPNVKNQYLKSQQVERTVLLAPPKVGGGIVSLHGQIRYFDDNHRAEKPIRRLKVRLFEWNVFLADTQIDFTFTDHNGNYAFSILDNIDPEDSTGRDLYVIISFENDILKLTNDNNVLYQFQSPIAMNVSDGELRLDFSLDSSHQQRVTGHIFNAIQNEYDFLMEKVNWNRNQIPVRWPMNSWAGFDPGRGFGDEYIWIATELQWDHSVMLHEYGHAVMYTVYNNNFPKTSISGAHYIYTVSDAGFALIEGWAEFMEALVDDNAFNILAYRGRKLPNIETNDWWRGDADGRGNNTSGEIVEGAVASILWDIADTPASIDHQPTTDDDSINDMFPQIWLILVQKSPQSVLDFWHGWLANGYGSIESLRDIYFDHGIVLPLPGKSAEERTISMPQYISGSPGQKGIIVPINIDELKDIAGGDIMIIYNPNLLSAVNVKTTELTSGFTVNFSLSSGGIIIYFSNPTGLDSGGGAILEVVLDVKPDAEIDRLSGLILEYVSLYDEKIEKISLTTKDGSFIIKGIIGDLNRDGLVDAADAVLALQIAIQKREPDDYQKAVGDVNGDGLFDLTDVISILQQDVGLSSISPR